MTEAMKFEKYQVVSKATFIVLLCSAIFLTVIYYMRSISSLDGYMFDVSTVTAKDYTVEMNITSDMWEYFEDNQYVKIRNLPIEER